MSNVEKKGRIPSCVGQASLAGSYYVAECTLCGWVGSSEALTDDCQCTQEFGDRYCLGDTDEIGSDRLLEIVQAMAQRYGESQQDYLDRPAFRRHPVAIIDGNDRGVYGQQQAVHR
ncbi:hypothetical protein [Pseudomonas aeruginosa]|uniref:hypothetical protein n=1 Tax=Pseudomonas aeruginosa TaxID=287 RepID=UPI003F4A8D94